MTRPAPSRGAAEAAELIDGLVDSVAVARRLLESAPSSRWLKETDSGHEHVTDLDMAIEELLLDRITTLRPDAQLISEESCPDHELQPGLNVVIDPIDGTSQLLRGSDDYAICVAVVIDGQAHGALVDLPAHRTTLRSHDDATVTVNGRSAPGPLRTPGRTVAVSARQRAALAGIAELGDLHTVGACAPKLASLVAGTAAVALRLPPEPVHLWDYAAAGHLLELTGATLRTLDGAAVMTSLPRTHRGGWIGGRASECAQVTRALTPLLRPEPDRRQS